MSSETQVKEQLRQWIQQQANLSESSLDYDTPILAADILSSLDVVELILYIEEIKGEEVDIETIEPEALTNIDTIYRNLF